ncbi:hypothetical protein Nepgr_016132 [Nepenthes gracilis]|uniref:CBS domain-containing protein n=1 Tax=Nepenthes gracilis TaxID=150966 RepID=A0AAD3SPR9_NEPGR|nr:hypothetical protein Nepgr_016132 [Nepenthes gracilis]
MTITDNIFAVTNRTKAIDVVRCTRTAALHAVPIVEAPDFVEHVYANPSHGISDLVNSTAVLVTCYIESTLGEVVNRAVSGDVHQVWVVDRGGLLLGPVSLTGMIRAIRVALLSQFP